MSIPGALLPSFPAGGRGDLRSPPPDPFDDHVPCRLSAQSIRHPLRDEVARAAAPRSQPAASRPGKATSACLTILLDHHIPQGEAP